MALDGFDKQPVETYTIATDFADRLPTGTSPNAGTVTAFDPAGTDVSAIVLSGGVATISGTEARIKVLAGTHGLNYRLRFVVTLTNGDVREKDVIMRVANL